MVVSGFLFGLAVTLAMLFFGLWIDAICELRQERKHNQSEKVVIE